MDILGITHHLGGRPYTVVNIAQHTEKGQKFVVYSNDTDHFLLRALELAGTDERVEIPTNTQFSDVMDTVWEHFKSKTDHPMTYLVHGVGVNVDDLEQFVLYSPRYAAGKLLMKEQGVTCLARPRLMFFSEVEREEYKGPRFRRI